MNQIIATIKALTRTCPKCGRNQVVKPSQKRRTVPCVRCGCGVPPTSRYG